MSRTVGYLVTEARQILNDETPITGAPRFPDDDLVTAVNDGVAQIRTKRPDAFLRFGLRKSVPVYSFPGDEATLLPFDDIFYAPLLNYVVGRSELTEDTYSDDGRAVAMLNKFVAQLLRVAS
jgi:hypothetical protein